MSEEQIPRPYQEEAVESLVGEAREAFESGGGARALVVLQEMGTGNHLVQGLFALAVRRQLGRRTLVVQPGTTLLDYSVEEARRFANTGETVSSVRELGLGALTSPDVLVTNSHPARVGPIADRCPRDHFGVVIFDQVGGYSKGKLGELAREFPGAGLHLFWNPTSSLPFLDGRALQTLEGHRAGAVVIARWPGDYAAALAGR